MTRLTHFAGLVAVAGILAFTSACTEAVGCDFRNVEGGLNNGPEDRCQERTGVQAIGFDAACEGLGGEAIAGGCDREGIVFGCAIGPDVVDWHYAPTTIDEAASECGSDEVVDAP
jgi:hypothetical protein